MFDMTPIPLRLYLIQGFDKGASEAFWVVAQVAFIVFVFSLSGGKQGPGESLAPQAVVGVAVNGGTQ